MSYFGTVDTTAGQIPRGVADYFWEEAYRRHSIEQTLLEIFRSWGYGDVIPPTFEYADTLSARGNRALQSEMCRFLDRDGSTMALRVDMTIPVARLVATRLHDHTMPQRFCYAGSVFRDVEPRAGQQREFRQAGVELIGSAVPAADAEVLALAAKALTCVGLEDFRIVVGQMQYFDGLLQALALPPAEAARLQQAVDHNSEAELAGFLADTRLPRRQQRAVAELPALSGVDRTAILARAEKLCLNRLMQTAVDNLQAILQEMSTYAVAEHIALDLTEIHNLGYYTGITFEVLAPGVGYRLASGGRYDNLIGTFGVPQPAVGLAFGIERLLLAQRVHTGEQPTPKPMAPDLWVSTGHDPRCLAIIDQGRHSGLWIAADLGHRHGEALWAAATAAGATRALEWQDRQFVLYEQATAEMPPLVRTLSPDDAVVYLATLAAHRQAAVAPRRGGEQP